ncbi:hypothetical protein ATK36_3439 [Amycolatopsis sulphurea]|uniref:Uncharacterized protein n=1 Tax=Amycolatopsis sulphurea TaxID=76022 RepID=A0A2A9FAJ2_9PSEU|nr:hypothetical protein [Amycolatopsis sulphurea]PFG48354.1 hypothetical protein ATK36_3439 [Amycolatopsis sulphurea]
MTNAAAHERRGATRAGRLASRALFVLGGAVAATAAAWAVSSASASASATPAVDVPAADGASDTSVPSDGPAGNTLNTSITPITDATVADLGDMTRETSRLSGAVAGAAIGAANQLASCAQSATSWSAPGATRPDCEPEQGSRDAERSVTSREVADRVSAAVAEFGDRAVLRPVQRGLGSLEHIVRKPEDTKQVLTEATKPSPEAQEFGRTLIALLDPGHASKLVELPALPVLPSAHPVETLPAAAPAAADETPGAAAMSISDVLQPAFASADAPRKDIRTGVRSSNQHHSDLPSVPFGPVQLPIAPLSVPTMPGGSTAPGGHLDGLNLGVPQWVTAAADSAVAGMSRVGVRHVSITPGEQPGVTPD